MLRAPSRRCPDESSAQKNIISHLRNIKIFLEFLTSIYSIENNFVSPIEFFPIQSHVRPAHDTHARGPFVRIRPSTHLLGFRKLEGKGSGRASEDSDQSREAARVLARLVLIQIRNISFTFLHLIIVRKFIFSQRRHLFLFYCIVCQIVKKN